MPGPLLWPNYAKLLRALVDSPITWKQASEATGLSRNTAPKLLRALDDMDEVHVCRWEIPEGGSAKSRLAVYALGPGESVPWPGGSRTRKRMGLPAQLVVFMSVVRALKQNAYHGAGVAREVGIHHQSGMKIIKALKRQRLIYVSDYDLRPSAGYGARLYEWGPDKRDKAKPAARSRRELWTEWNARRARRRQHAELSFAVVHGMPLDKRLPRVREAIHGIRQNTS